MATATVITTILAFIGLAIKQDHSANPGGTFDLSPVDAVQFGVFPNPPTSPATSNAFVALGPFTMQITDEGTPLGKLTHTCQLTIQGWASVTADLQGSRNVGVGNLLNDVVSAVYTSARVSGGGLFDRVRSLHVSDVQMLDQVVKSRPTYAKFTAVLEFVYETTQGDGV